MRIDRMLGIVVLLLNRDRISAKQLAERFEVSVRTVYRDIESINLAGIPIITYSGAKGGFGIMENYRLDRQVLSIEDMFSIVTALKGVNSTIGINDLDTVAEKILNLVPVDKLESLKQHFEEFAIDLMPWGFKQKSKEYIKQIQQAVTSRLCIQFLYVNSRGENLLRTVEPMTLIFKGYAWYLFAFCYKRYDFRIFRLSRMEELKTTTQTFERKTKSYQEFMNMSIDRSNFINLVLKFSPAAKIKVQEFFEEAMVRKLDDGFMLVSILFPADEWLYSTILSFGDLVEVIEPLEVRNAIINKTKKILCNYNADILLSQN
jgi:predicted DNA-binding transcriptional regulator YafY